MQLPLTSVEIFAGGGGMALGMTRAGFEHRALVEWWKPAVDVLRANSSPSTWDQNDVLAEDVRKVLPQLSERGVPTLLAGGPPCQPFSLAGASAGHSDARNMFPASLEIVRALRPPLVVFENVPGLLRPSFLPYLEYVQDQLSRPSIEPARADELWFEHHKRIVASRSDREYVVQRLELDAADLGVPQMRKRIFLVAIRSDLLGTAWQGVTLTHSKSALLHDQWISGCYWERHGLVRPRVIPPRLLREVERLRETGRPKLPAWRTLRDLLSVMPRPGKAAAPRGWPDHVAIPGARTYANHTGSAIDMPSKTIKAGVHGVAGGEGMLRGLTGKVRYLSIREAAMAQGFPQSYEFPGVRSRMMGVIGNAVAVDVAAAIGRSLSKQLIG